MRRKRTFSRNLNLDPFVPYQVRGGPSASVEQKRTFRGRNERVGILERREMGRRRGTLKFTALIFFQEMASTHKRHE